MEINGEKEVGIINSVVREDLTCANLIEEKESESPEKQGKRPVRTNKVGSWQEQGEGQCDWNGIGVRKRRQVNDRAGSVGSLLNSPGQEHMSGVWVQYSMLFI